jgi:hypothetical protein
MRLLKFDSVHPYGYLKINKEKWGEQLNKWSLKEYYEKLIGLRVNFSDFYTFHLNNNGFQSEEFFPSDTDFIKKVESELYGDKVYIKNKINQIKKRIGISIPSRKLRIISDYIEWYKPDIIFCREHTSIPSSFWKKFRHKSLVVARLSAPIPDDWSPLDFDVIYTDIDSYTKFFQVNGIKVRDNLNGFDTRILDEIKTNKQKFQITFIGGLGGDIFSKRTKLFEEIAEVYGNKFHWWGYLAGPISKPLEKCYQGTVAGLEMFEIYKNSSIVINDYIDFADNAAVNQRLYEVMGVGSLLITKYSDSLWDRFPKDSIITFRDSSDCIQLIEYYLNNPEKADLISDRLKTIVHDKYNYSVLISKLAIELKEDYYAKFS